MAFLDKQKEGGRKKGCGPLLAVLTAAALLVVSVGDFFYGQVAEVFDTGAAGTLTQIADEDILKNGEKFYNLLVLGIDHDPADVDGLHNYDNGKGNTDVVLYVQIDREAGAVNVLQIPRDSYAGETFLDGTRLPTGRINAAYASGPDQKNLINNVANKVYELFRLPVDNYVTIDMASFKTLLNVMGGITMHVPWDIVDSETGALLVPAGTHAVSGDTAEVILRNRNYGTADYQRLETQQYFYAALIRTFLEDYTLADYYTACRNLAHYINTDLDITEIYGLYATMTSIDPANIFVIRAPGGPIEAYKGHTWLYGIDREKMAEILNTHFRSADAPVAAEDLGLYDGWDYTLGETVDEGKTLGSLNAGEDGDPNDVLHRQAAGAAG